jgi:uracil-DNA glycosylase family 4
MSQNLDDLDQVILSAKTYLENSSIKYFYKTITPVLEKADILVKEKVNNTEYALLGYEELKQIALNCTKCNLCETRKNVVFGKGKVNSPLIAFIGERPGAEEDFHAEPFIGEAGQFLDLAITKGLKLRREDVYLTNIVKCKPPENRKPHSNELLSCKSYLERQLELIKPQTIVCLGENVLRGLIDLEENSEIRGQWLEWNGIPLMPTFDPIFVLQNPSVKRDFWQDLKLVMEKLGIN